MKIATIIIRILIGLLLLLGGVTYFLHIGEEPQFTGNLKTYNDGLNAAGFLMPLVKAIEIICGLSFLTGKFIKATAVLLLPISINILLLDIFLMPEGLVVGLILFLSNVFLIYRNWDSYKHLVKP